MSLAESAASSYADAVVGAVPLHRAALALVSAISFLTYRTTFGNGALSALISIRLVELTDLSGPILRAALVGDLVIGVLIVFLSVLMLRLSLHLCFRVALRSTSLISRINAIPLKSETMGFDERKQAIEWVESVLEKRAKRIRALNRLAEFLWGLSIMILMVSFFRSYLDLVIGTMVMLFAFTATVKATVVFISEYFGMEMYLARLEGRAPSQPLELS